MIYPIIANFYIFLCLTGVILCAYWVIVSIKRKRIMEDFPTSKVQSLSMGFVELKGRAKPLESPLTSPIFNRPCCYWRCQIKKHGRSQTIDSESPSLFYLQDDTGEVLVDASKATLFIEVESFYDGLDRVKKESLSQRLNPEYLNYDFVGEQIILVGSELFVQGEAAHFPTYIEKRKSDFNSFLRKAKSDPDKMEEADTNQDGTIDSEEWDQFRLKLEKDFIENQLNKLEDLGPTVVIRTPSQGKEFIISDKQEEKRLKASRINTGYAIAILIFLIIVTILVLQSKDDFISRKKSFDEGKEIYLKLQKDREKAMQLPK